MGGAGVMDVECPLDLRFTARSIESWLLQGGWDAPTAETTSRLATGHVRDRDRWVLLGLGPAPESIPVAPPTAFAGSRDGAVRVDVSRRYVAWGRMWARMPGAPVRDVWQGRAAWTEEVYARHRNQMWGQSPGRGRRRNGRPRRAGAACRPRHGANISQRSGTHRRGAADVPVGTVAGS